MKYPYIVERILDHYPKLGRDFVVSQVRLSSFVSLDKRYLYYQVPKAASTQVMDLLRVVEGASPLKMAFHEVWGTHRYEFVHARLNLPLPSLIDLDDKTQREVLESPDFFRMTIVRNPYTRLVSSWRNRIYFCEPIGSEVYIDLRGGLPGIHNKSVVSFEEFVRYLENGSDLRTCNGHWRRQVDQIFFPALNFNHIGKVERFVDTLESFRRHLGLSDPLAAGRSNVSLPIGSAKYTQELADTVYRLYRADFEVFEYDPDSWLTNVGAGAEKRPPIPEEKFYDEIVERNLVILGLYRENQRMETQLHRVSRLHLLPFVNALAACRASLRNLDAELTRWKRRLLRRTRRERPSSAVSV